MKCPKCGQVYEEGNCPNCNPGPKIIVNNTDYLRRKEAYEKKQAENESASSYSGKIQKDISGDKERAEQKKQKSKEYEEIDYLGIMKKTYAAGKDIAQGAAKELSKKKGFFKKKRKKLFAAVFFMCAAAIVIAAVCRLAGRKNYVLYMSSDSKIYNVAGLENDYVCDNAQAVFAADNRTFYTPQYPQQIAESMVTGVMASDNGEYFAAVVYSESTGNYSLYTWKDGHEAVLVSENAHDKEIGCITENGKVIYTDIEVVNEEGGLGDILLCIYEPAGRLVIVEQGLKEYFVYEAKEKIICCNKNNVLYIYDYAALKKEEELSDSVRNVCAESAEMDNFFTAKAAAVNSSKNADSLIYSDNGEWYYYNISEKSNKFIMQEVSSAAEFVYEEKAGYLYLLTPGKISYAQITQEGTEKITELASLSQADYIYISSDNILVYINEDKQLCYSEKGKYETIADNVLAGTLSRVGNTQAGITYIKDNVQYYCSTVKHTPVKMCDTPAQADTADTLFYKNRLYFYNADGQLYSCTKKGKGLEKVGDVSRFWLGTTYG